MAAKAAELQVVVGADTSQAEHGLQSLSGKISGIAGGLGKLAAAGIGAVAAGFGAVTVAAAGFEKSLSGISAVSGATADEMGKISALALQLGKDTSFSAGEAAAGIEELVKGGLSLEDIFSGGAKAALDLAAAGSLSVADAAEIAANAVGQFGLKGAELGAAADLIAGAANASQISVTDFKFSLAAVGAVANLVGFDFQDTAVAIAEMGRQGIKGSDAGTSLKAMLMNLQPSTKKASAEMRALGLVTEDGKNQFFDAAGNVKKMADVQGILQNATKNLTAEQKLASLEILFGSDGIRAATVLAKQGAEGYNEMATAMGKVTAADVARERLNNLAGSVEMLKGSLETAAISVGLKFTPALKGLADDATAAVNAAIPELERLAGVAVTAGQTFMQAFKGDWSPNGVDASGNIIWVDPFVAKMGDAGLAAKAFGDYLGSPAFQGSAGGAAKNMADFNVELDKLLGKLPQVQASAAGMGDFFNLETNSAALVNFVERINALVDIAGKGAEAVTKFFESIGRAQLGDVLGAKEAMEQAKAAAAEIPVIWDTAVQKYTERMQTAKAQIATAAAEAFASLPKEANASINMMSAEVTAGFGTLAGDFSTGWDLITANTTTELASLPVETQSTMNVMSTDVTAGFGTLAGDFSTGWQTIVTNTETELPKVSAAVETNMAAAEVSAATGGDAIVTTLTASFGEAVTVAETEMPRLSAAVAAESGPAAAAAGSVGEAIVAGVEPPLQGLSASGHSAGSGLVGAFVSGVRGSLSAARAVVEEMVEGIRALLPGSDAEEGPLSDLTASGAAIPETMAAGVYVGAPALDAAVAEMAGRTAATAGMAFQGIRDHFNLVIPPLQQQTTAAAKSITDTAGLSFQGVRDKFNLTIPPLVSEATMSFQQVRDHFNLVVPPLRDVAGMTFQQVRDNFNLVIPPLQGQAATALRGVSTAAGSAFANVKTGGVEAFAAVGKSAATEMPKVKTNVDTVGKEVVGTTADVDKFGKEIETLKATKGAVDGLSQSWQDLAGSIGQALQKLIAFNKESGSGGGGGQGGDANISVPGNFAIPTFGEGGIVRGGGSRPVLVGAHPGEAILSLAQQHNLARVLASPPAGSDGGARIINVTVPITGSLIQQSEAEQWIAAAVRSAMDGGRL